MLASRMSHGSDYYHWHLEILPRDFRSSKYKREDEFHVVSITPEEAAYALKTQKGIGGIAFFYYFRNNEKTFEEIVLSLE